MAASAAKLRAVRCMMDETHVSEEWARAVFAGMSEEDIEALRGKRSPDPVDPADLAFVKKALSAPARPVSARNRPNPRKRRSR